MSDRNPIGIVAITPLHSALTPPLVLSIPLRHLRPPRWLGESQRDIGARAMDQAQVETPKSEKAMGLTAVVKDAPGGQVLSPPPGLDVSEVVREFLSRIPQEAR